MNSMNDKQLHGMLTGEYICPECGEKMIFENDDHYVLLCEKCGYNVEYERFGYSDEEYEALYPTALDVLGYDPYDFDDDEDEDPDIELYGEFWE